MKLDDLGISKDESARFQQIASVPKPLVEQAFKEARKTQTPVTSAQMQSVD